MEPTNPRIIVSSATFDSEENFASRKQESVGRVSTIDRDDYTHPRPLATASPVKHTQEQSWVQNALSWAPELIWCLLSIVLLMGLVMVLSNFDGKPLPDLPLGLTLNTVIAILTTASRAVTVFLIGQGISQMKWNQYVGVEKPLRNLSIFDEASRGPWGSLKMVFTTRGGFLAFMASFLIITSLASSTLTQSAITYTPRLVAEDKLSAKAQYCDAYPCGKSFEAGPDALNEFTNSLETAAFGAVFNNVERNWPILEPQCQSADCKWAEINSLAVCYEIRNITDKLDVNATVEGSGLMATTVNKASLMNGTAYLHEADNVTMGSYSYAVNITALNPDFFLIPQGKADLTFPFPRNTIAFGGDDDKNLLDTTFSQLLMIYINLMTDYENPSTRYRAVEVLMHFCVKTLEVEVKQGQSSTKSVKSHTSITDLKASTVQIDGGGETGYFELSSPDGNDTFRLIESADYGQLDEDFDRAFSGYYSDRLREEAPSGEMTRQIGLNMFRALPRNTPAKEADGKVIKNLERVMDTIATSMTNYMREVGKESAGTAFTSATFVQVRWEWLTLVAAQVVLSIAFLLTVVVGTARLGVDVVKSTNTAELFAIPSRGCGLGCKDDEVIRSHELEMSTGIKTEVEKGVEATLMKGAEGWQLRIRPQKAKV